MRRAARRAVIASRPSKTEQDEPRSARPGSTRKAKKISGKLTRKADFDAVYRNGKRRSSSHFTVFLKANDLPQSRFGFSIKRALGGAVVRNRMSRRMREMVRLALRGDFRRMGFRHTPESERGECGVCSAGERPAAAVEGVRGP